MDGFPQETCLNAMTDATVGRSSKRRSLQTQGPAVACVASEPLAGHCRDNPLEKASTNNGRQREKVPDRFWQEVFSAGTMVLPSVYAYCNCAGIAANASFPQGIWAVTFSTYGHCLASVAFHLQCAFCNGPSFNQFESPFRTADMAFIHLCCFWYAFAISHGDLFIIAINAMVNAACVVRLVRRRLLGVPGARTDSLMVISCIFLYTAAVPLRGYWWDYTLLLLAYGLGGVMWASNAKMAGWGHGLFHICLTPAIHFLMNSVAKP